MILTSQTFSHSLLTEVAMQLADSGRPLYAAGSRMLFMYLPEFRQAVGLRMRDDGAADTIVLNKHGIIKVGAIPVNSVDLAPGVISRGIAVIQEEKAAAFDSDEHFAAAVNHPELFIPAGSIAGTGNGFVQAVLTLRPWEIHPALYNLVFRMQARHFGLYSTIHEVNALQEKWPVLSEEVNLPWIESAFTGLITKCKQSNASFVLVSADAPVGDGIALFEATPYGLLITLCDIDDLRQLLAEHGSDDRRLLHGLLEDAGLIGNGWEEVRNMGLTEAPMVGYDLINLDDEGNNVDYARLWYYPDYMVKNFAEELLNNGYVVFTEHKQV